MFIIPAGGGGVDPELAFTGGSGSCTANDSTGESARITLNSDGTISGLPSLASGPNAYLSPTGAGKGDNYRARLSSISISGSGASFTFGGTSYSSGTTAWFNLSANQVARLIYGDAPATMTGTIEIESLVYGTVVTNGISLSTS